MVLTLLQNFKHALEEDVANENGPGGRLENTEVPAITSRIEFLYRTDMSRRIRLYEK